MIKNIGIVGTGDIATQFVTQIDKSKYSIHSVFNRNEVSLKRFTDIHNLSNGFSDYQLFLKDENLECVYIATPNQTHYEYVKEAILADKHVLCEKVMVLEGHQAEELYTLAKKHNVILLEAVTLFYMPMYHQVSTLLKEGILGKISGSNIMFGSCKEYDPTNRFFSLEKGGGALFDIGTYALSAAVYLMGTDLSVLASEVVMSETGVDEKSVTLLKNKNNELASVSLSFRGKMPKQIVLTGDQGYLVIDDFPRAEVGTIYFNDGKEKIIDTGDGVDVFTYEMDMLNAYALEEYPVGMPELREVTKSVISLMDDMRNAWGSDLAK